MPEFNESDNKIGSRTIRNRTLSNSWQGGITQLELLDALHFHNGTIVACLMINV